MGGNISSLHRLRNRVLIKVYTQDTAKSVSDIFQGRGQTLSCEDLTAVFGKEAKPIIEDLLQTYSRSSSCSFKNDGIPRRLVEEFLESGSLHETAKSFANNNLGDTGRGTGTAPEIEIEKSLILYNKDNKNISFSTPAGNLNPKNFKNLNINLENVWKKHETVIQERTVRHITIENGITRELIETDKSQNEVVHIEDKTTGEFAHREYSQQEQTEELDGEMATFIRATEDYIHLKSATDEYEYVHSDVPKTNDDDGDAASCDADGGAYDNSDGDEDDSFMG